jgi:hypothetical protein
MKKRRQTNKLAFAPPKLLARRDARRVMMDEAGRQPRPIKGTKLRASRWISKLQAYLRVRGINPNALEPLAARLYLSLRPYTAFINKKTK